MFEIRNKYYYRNFDRKKKIQVFLLNLLFKTIFIQVGKGFMDKLEQVSEKPELKEEMEAEVASSNSNQVNDDFQF